MRLKNHTDLPDAWIRAVIRATCPPGVSGFDVRISNGRGRGKAYPQGSGYHDRAVPFVKVYVPRTDAEARGRRAAHGAYLGIHVGDRRELLVKVLAHELRHLWQGKGRRARHGMVWGARGRYSERDADAYALQMLRRYRRGELDLTVPAEAPPPSADERRRRMIEAREAKARQKLTEWERRLETATKKVREYRGKVKGYERRRAVSS